MHEKNNQMIIGKKSQQSKDDIRIKNNITIKVEEHSK